MTSASADGPWPLAVHPLPPHEAASRLHRDNTVAAVSSRALTVLMACAALVVAAGVSWMVDAQVRGDYAMAFRMLWWLILAFNIIDAIVQRHRVESWTTLLLKYVMVGVTYSVLV